MTPMIQVHRMARGDCFFIPKVLTLVSPPPPFLTPEPLTTHWPKKAKNLPLCGAFDCVYKCEVKHKQYQHILVNTLETNANQYFP